MIYTVQITHNFSKRFVKKSFEISARNSVDMRKKLNYIFPEITIGLIVRGKEG